MNFIHKIIAWVKEHPWLTAAIVFGLGLLIVLWYFSGRSSGTTVQVGATPTDNSAQLADIAAQAASHQSDNSLEAQLAGIAAGLEGLKASSSVNQAVALAGIQAQRDVELAKVDAANYATAVQAYTVGQVTESTEFLSLPQGASASIVQKAAPARPADH